MDERITAIDLAIQQGDFRKAEILIARALRSDNLESETRAEVLLRRAKARLNSGRPEDALSEANESIALRPSIADSPEMKVLLGDIYFARFVLAEFGFADRNNTDQARAYYDEVLKNTPDYPQRAWVYYQRGCIYLSENKSEAAINDLHQALAHDANPPFVHAYAYERLGFIALFEERNANQAAKYFENAIATYPTTNSIAWIANVHILRSRALTELGDYQAALEAASNALESLDSTAQDYRSTLTETHLAIGEVLAHIPGREVEAIEHLLQFLQNSKRPLGVDVTWSRVYETLGNLSLKLKRYEQAIEAYQASLQYNPYHPWEINIHYQIARCYYRMRAYERVISSVEQMQAAANQDKQSITDYRVYYVLANAFFALERYQEAADAYGAALQLAPPGADNINKIQQYLQYSLELALN